MNPPAAKLPMVTRKNFRDNWENKKTDYEQQLSAALGGQGGWTITTEAALLYANCSREDMLDRLGDGVTWYIEPLISNARRWAEDYGAEGVAELDALVPTHKVELRPQDDETKFTYGGLHIKDGVLRLVYALDSFVTNVDDVSTKEAFAEAIKTAAKAGAPGAVKGALNINSRKNIRTVWEPRREELRKEIGDLVNMPNVTLEPQFEQVAQSLLDAHAPKDKNEEYTMGADLTRNLEDLGATAVSYYEALVYYLKYHKFGEDDMLQEGFQEAVPSGKIGLRTVPKLEKKSYCETVIEDGVLWMQSTPGEWRVNIDSVAETIMDIL